MTKIAIMQPYLFPYLGYFQLIAAVDQFVLLDDVNFIKQGWIHRNRILWREKPHLFTWPIVNMSQNRWINQHQFCHFDKTQKAWCQIIRQAYSKAPYFENIFPWLCEMGAISQTNIVPFIRYSLEKLSDFLGIKTDFCLSSDCDIDKTLRGEARILALCRFFGATQYFNLSGGVTLYQKENFDKENIQLRFIRMQEMTYPQFGVVFVPSLSIVDVLMFNTPEKFPMLLGAYEIVC